MQAIYEPGEDAGEGAKITLGLGMLSHGEGCTAGEEGGSCVESCVPNPETFVLFQGDSPQDVPAAFEEAVQDHPDIQVV